MVVAADLKGYSQHLLHIVDAEELVNLGVCAIDNLNTVASSNAKADYALLLDLPWNSMSKGTFF